MRGSSHVVVVGGGVVGCACAYFLAREGVGVTILEREGLGAGASGHATGYFPMLDLPPGPDLDLGVEGMRLMREMVGQLQEESGVDVLWTDRPVLNLAFDEEEVTLHRQRMEGAAYALPTEWLNRDEALKMEPRLNPDILGACYQDALPQMDSYRTTMAYAYATERHGGTMLLREATGLEGRGDAVTAVNLSSGSVPCDAVVLAMGAWTRAASDWLGVDIPVVPLRGERLELRYSGEPMSVHLHSPLRGHVISRADGAWSVGSIGGRDFDRLEEYMQWSPQPTPEGKLELLDRALSTLPCLEDAEITQHLAGVRPHSVDNRPIIGPVPGWSNVYVATGHYSKGIRCSASTGKIIADLVLRGATDVRADARAFYPARFARTL